MSKTTMEKAKKILFFVLNLVLSIITMSLIFTLTGHAANEDVDKTSLFLGFVILSVIAYQAFLFIKYPNAKDRIRLIIISLIYAVAVIFAFGAKNNYKFFFITAFIVVVAVGTSQILRVFIHNKENVDKKEKKVNKKKDFIDEEEEFYNNFVDENKDFFEDVLNENED